MRRLPFLLLFLALVSGRVDAAGFDCAKAATSVEKKICADHELSRLDDSLAVEYQRALTREADGAALKSGQLAWLKHKRNACKTEACLRGAYEARIAELRGGAAIFPDASSAVIGTCASLAAAAEADATHCRVTDSGDFGRVGDIEQRFAVYCLDAPTAEEGRSCDLTALALFSVDPRTGKAERWLQRVDVDAQGNDFGKPEIIEVNGAVLLDVPVSIPGTGAFNASALYRREGDRWMEVDSTGWEKEFSAGLPKGLAVWKGIWPNWRRMHASTGLYREKDANCCATGGTAEIELALQGNRIALVSYRILPPRR